MTPAESTTPAPSRRGLWLVVLSVLVLLGVSTWDALRQDSGRAFRRAAYEEDLPQMEEMLRRRPDLVNSRGTTNLLMRCYTASPEWLIDFLPKWKLDKLAEAEAFGVTALHWAASRTNLAAINLLLAAGASPDAQMANGVTPMRLAIAHRREDIVLLFIQAGANLNSTNSAIANPLATAADCGDKATNITRLLLSHGANPNASIADGVTPLHWAGRFGQLETARLLVEAGANLNATNAEGLTPLGYALKYNSTNGIALLQSLGATP